ncbi:TolC family protein [Bremerella sp. JC817]|uniref:TolC family protein n=1 Tax=Bremerella sp. JC817 TaxID=3231756 RepID=UPI00345B0765
MSPYRLATVAICIVAFHGMQFECVHAQNHQPEARKEIAELLTSPPDVGLATAAPGVRWNALDMHADVAPSQHSLAGLLELASRNNPTILQAQYQITGQLAKAQQAGLYPNPMLAYVAENIGVEGTAGEWQGGEIEQRFVTGHKLQISRDKYLQRAKVAEHLAVAQQYRVCNDVRVHYFKTLAAQRILDLQRELLKTSEDHLTTTREMFNAGQANQVDLHRANAQLRRQQLAVLQAENRIRREFLQLGSLVGVELAQLPLEGNLESGSDLIDFDLSSERILSQSPEILAAHSKLREDQITLNRESVEWVPDIIVAGGVGRNFESQDTTGAMSVRMELPIFDRNQGTIRQAQADYVRQQKEIRRTEMDLKMRLAQQYEAYLSAAQHVLTYEELVLPELKQAYANSLQSYKEDRVAWPAVLMAYENYTQRRIEYIDHLLQRRTSEIMLNGFLLHGGLNAASSPTPTGHIDATPKPR